VLLKIIHFDKKEQNPPKTAGKFMAG